MTLKARSVLFSAPMVRALLADQKGQTRRILKPQPTISADEREVNWRRSKNRFLRIYDGSTGNAVVRFTELVKTFCPYGQPGDLLWVRETWAQPTSLDPGPTFYRADYPACVPSHFENVPPVDGVRWKPSIHMPRAQSRITLRVTDLRVERLTDISEEDARAEGITDSWPEIECNSDRPFRDGYRWLWEEINGAESWTANPWVWVLGFERIKTINTGELL